MIFMRPPRSILPQQRLARFPQEEEVFKRCCNRMCQYPREMHCSARGAQEPRALLLVRVHIMPRPRQRLRAAAGLATDDLVDRHVVVLERVGAAREVHAPDAKL